MGDNVVNENVNLVFWFEFVKILFTDGKFDSINLIDWTFVNCCGSVISKYEE